VLRIRSGVTKDIVQFDVLAIDPAIARGALTLRNEDVAESALLFQGHDRFDGFTTSEFVPGRSGCATSGREIHEINGAAGVLCGLVLSR
jgi:hypothetical protein